MNLMKFSSFNESKESIKKLSKDIKELKKKRDQLLVVRPKKEKDSDVIELNKKIDNKEKDYKAELAKK